MGSCLSQTSDGFVKPVGGSCYNLLMRVRKERYGERYGKRYGDFGFDAAGRLCELSRADRNRHRRGQPIRNIGARSANYALPPGVREWHRAFAGLPADVALFEFEHRDGYDWWFTLGIHGVPFTFVPTWLARVPTRTKAGLIVLDRRKHPRRAAALVANAVRQLNELMTLTSAPYYPPRREVS